jgi:UDP-N-acetyl-2-amino-2-deoxyglucuronate dehydrogenase
MKKYVLLGGAGYVAPKHYDAIKETGGELIAILDPHDNVGILDSYFPKCQYFREFERFDRFCSDQDIDYTVVCSPNYLHSSHCAFGLRIGSDVICEKPLVLRERNLDGLLKLEESTGHKIWNILQLRLGATSIYKKYISEWTGDKDAFLAYSVARGSWYDYSWKSNIEKSGGILFNIGIHLFDLLLFLFGQDWTIKQWESRSDRYEVGTLLINDWVVDVDLEIFYSGKSNRILDIGEEEFDLSKRFAGLHTVSYKQILAGKGFGIEEVRPAIALCEKLRSLT